MKTILREISVCLAPTVRGKLGRATWSRLLTPTKSDRQGEHFTPLGEMFGLAALASPRRSHPPDQVPGQM